MTARTPAPPGQFEMHRHMDSHGVVLALRGELDVASASGLEQELTGYSRRDPNA
jgi:anti-anti-sigma regulatory factor